MEMELLGQLSIYVYGLRAGVAQALAVTLTLSVRMRHVLARERCLWRPQYVNFE